LPISRDAYVSFRGSHRRDFGEITDPAPVILVDFDAHDAELLRSIPPTFLGQRAGTVLIRLRGVIDPDAKELSGVRELLKRWDPSLRVALLTHPLGSEPVVEHLWGPALQRGRERELLRRARAVELEALLEFGQAIWRPRGYHYRLITGEHAAAYIKLGDAIRAPRDAAVLASWLNEAIQPEMGVVFDTGTLTPLGQAVQLNAQVAGVDLGPVLTLDNYPRTGVDIDAVLDRASGDEGKVLIVLSISSSGSLLERILGALARKGESMPHRRIEILVDKAAAPAGEPEGVEVWTPLEGQQPLVPRGSRDQIGCPLCRELGRAPLVPINPFTFDALLPTQLTQIVPDTDDPRENRLIWEAAARSKALAVERAPHAALRRYRSDRVPMGIKMQVERLMPDEEFREALRAKLVDRHERQAMPLDADLVLTPKHELEGPGFDEFWAAIRDVIAPAVGKPQAFPVDEDFSTELAERVKEARSILVFQLGTVSGASVQHALIGVQSARSDPDFKLHAFVVHVRPATLREWQAIANSYGRHGKQLGLRYGWKSVLPDRSPLKEELVQLRTLNLAEFDPNARSFVSKRLELCDGKYTGDEPAVLWGSEPGSRLTPNSLYGQRLDPVTTYVAVGSAMAAALHANMDGASTLPELRVFEVAAMARSYYDPMILGCFLRWMRPHETFWGWTGAEATTTALHILERGEHAQRHILVPEMLLAAAQGKLTREAATEAVGVARQLVEEKDCPEHVLAALQAGLALVPDPKQLPATEGAHEPDDASGRDRTVDDRALDGEAIATDGDLAGTDPGPEAVSGDR
jgi:hypothetical protein